MRVSGIRRLVLIVATAASLLGTVVGTAGPAFADGSAASTASVQPTDFWM